MNFFVRENFNLPSGAFQSGINTVTAANGTVYQDGTYGYIKTYANADAGIIYSDALTQAEYSQIPFKATIVYTPVSLTASDTMVLFSTTYSATAPSISGGVGTLIIFCYIYNNAGTYEERWRYYDTSGTAWFYKGSTNTWTNVSSDYVRTVSLATEYTLTINYHPHNRTYTIDHDGAETAVTGATRKGTTEDIYWWMGDNSTADQIIQLTLTSLYVENIAHRNRFTLRNSFTSRYRKSPFLTVLNNLTTRHRNRFTLKNSILDYEPYRNRFSALNNIGVEGQLVYLDGAWQTVNIKGKQLDNAATVEIDGLDVSDKVTDWSIDYDDQVVAKTISVTIKDRAYAQSIKVRKYSDSDFDDARIEIIDHEGYSLGEFLIENKRETARNQNYACTLSGRSITALLDKPFSQPLQTLYDEATTKLEVVNDLASDKSIAVLWGIPDSVLPIGALIADDETPLGLIVKVVESGGGIVHTDREDNLVCAYKDYETTGKTPVMSLTSGDIVSISTGRTVPTGENSVEVSGYEDMAITGGWAKVTLESSKSKLRSNGYDTCILTARCWNEDNSIPDVDLIEEEEQTPARNDHYEISVSSMIDAEGGGVVEIKKKSDSSVVAGPYEIIDNRTIRVTTAMDDTDYLITYWGGETVTFSVDNYADVSPTEVLVKDGKAQTTLRASAGGGGWAVCSADYLDAQTAKVNVQISDPRVGSISMSADPSTVNVGGRSTNKIAVLDSEGYAAQNGLVVELSVSDQYDAADYTGNINPEQVTTTTEEITDGSGESPVYSTTEIEVTTEFPITALTSVYEIRNGVSYTDINYADVATFDGNTITLATPLPYPDTPLTVTYTSSGMATAEYIYPSSNTVPYDGRFNYVRGFCGEYGSCRVEIRGPSGNSASQGDGHVGATTIRFADSFTPKPNSNGQKRYATQINWGVSGWKPDVRTSKAQSKIENGNIAGWSITNITTNGPTLVELFMQANEKFYSYDGMVGDNVYGKRKVVDEDTGKPISNAEIYIDWSGSGTYDDDELDEGPLYTNTEGIFYFSKGKTGVTRNIKITKSGYEDLGSTITIPGDVYKAREDTQVYDTCTFDITVPVYWDQI